MTGCPACDEIQAKTGCNTVMCRRCSEDLATWEYMQAKKRMKVFAQARAQEEQGEENVE